MNQQNRLAATVRKVFERWLSARKIEALGLELIRAGIVARDEEQARYEAGPPIAPLHS